MLSESDCRTEIKFLIISSRSITNSLIESKCTQENVIALQPKQLTAKETYIYIKLMKHALKSLDIYVIGRNKAASTSQQQSTNSANLLNKEEKEMIENLGQIFSLLHPHTLKEIFSQTIDFLIEHTFKNTNISIISSYFLATPPTSCTFATILIEYLIDKMELMGCKTLILNLKFLKKSLFFYFL